MSTSNLFVEIVPLNPRESSKSASMSTRKKLKSTIICICAENIQLKSTYILCCQGTLVNNKAANQTLVDEINKLISENSLMKQWIAKFSKLDTKPLLPNGQAARTS